MHSKEVDGAVIDRVTCLGAAPVWDDVVGAGRAAM